MKRCFYVTKPTPICKDSLYEIITVINSASLVMENVLMLQSTAASGAEINCFGPISTTNCIYTKVAGTGVHTSINDIRK